jgi:G3E family GTPase
MSAEAHAMIPVVVLTGFLGSGKTTLLNRWLALGGGRAPGGGRLALVVNELGAVGIDGDLLPSGLTRQVELPGGCVCCQLDEDLIRTIDELAARDRDLELIVIETTGVADPLPIGWSLARPPLDRVVRLVAVVTVVDATLHPSNRALSPAVDAQVENADLLVLGKLDLASDADQRAVRDQLSAANPDSPVLAGSIDENAAELWSLLADPPLGGGRIAERMTRPHSHEAHGEPAHGFDSIALPIDGTLDFEELSAALEELPRTVVRLKGLARVVDRSTGSDEPREVAFHRVGARVSCEPVAGAPPAGHRMVAIGRHLDPGQLAACLRAAMIR